MTQKNIQEVLQRMSDKIDKVTQGAIKHSARPDTPKHLGVRHRFLAPQNEGVILLRVHIPGGDPNKSRVVDGTMVSYSLQSSGISGTPEITVTIIPV